MAVGHRTGRGLSCALLAILGAAAPSAAAETATLRSGAGLTLAKQEQLSPRLVSATVATKALPGPARVDVLLPAGYDAHPRRRYPVLYLLHGTSGGADDWTTLGGAEATTAGRPLIVVMPDIALDRDGGGWCTNWVTGKYSWETFHIGQLVPWVDRNLRTRRSRGGRAIAGLSQGGFCSMSYAARHPDLFGTAFSYSGAPDIAYSPDAAAASTVVINLTEMGLDGEPPNSMFGDRATNAVNYHAHNPASLAENLRDTRMFLFTGNGAPGPFDELPADLAGTPVETLVWRSTNLFHDRLEALGIPSFFKDYGPGTHSWPYWERDLQESIDPLMERFASPPPRPRTVTYTSAEDVYAVYGWRVALKRTAREFSTLGPATCRDFELAGSGSATVRTPPCFEPRARLSVTVGGERRALRAGRAGRLTVHVGLGPANPYQQYTAEAEVAGTRVYRTRVRISPRRAPAPAPRS